MERKRLSRREFLQWGMAAMATATLAGCGSAPAQPTPAPAGEAEAADTSASVPAAETIQIEYFTYDLGPANQSREAIRDAFQAANPDVTVKLTILPYGDVWEKIAATMAAGQPPDTMYGDFSLLRHALTGHLLDLTEFFNADPVLSKPDGFTMNMQDDIQAKYGTTKIVALILGTWVPILYYNQEIFDAANEPHPAEDWTWDDVRMAAQRLTDAEAGQWGFQFGTTLDHVGWLWWEQKPDDFWATPQIYPEKTLFDNPVGLKTMQLFYDLGYTDKSAIPPEESGGFQVYGGAFGAGKVAMYSGGDWDAGWGFRDLPFKWGMTFSPMMEKGYRPSLNTMVATNLISAATKNPEKAWEFIRFMTATEEGQMLIGQGAYETPVLKTVAHSDAVLKPEWAKPGYDIRVKAAELPGPMYTPYPLNINLWEFPGKFIDPTVEKLKTGEMTPEEAVAYLDSEGIPYFQKQKAEMETLK